MLGVLQTLLLLLLNRSAYALTCSLNMGYVNLGSYSFIEHKGEGLGTTASVQASCLRDPTDIRRGPVTVCVDLLSGPNARYNGYRTLINRTNHSKQLLPISIAAANDGGGNNIALMRIVVNDVNNQHYASQRELLKFNIPLSFSASLQARQLSAGYYSANFTSAAQFRVAEGQRSCPTVATVTENFSLNISATIMPTCTLSVRDLNFGSVSDLNVDLSATSTLSVACSRGADYTVSLSHGVYTSGYWRAMKRDGGHDNVFYQLYQEATHNTPWLEGHGAQRATGTGQEQRFTLYAQVPKQRTPPVGMYRDTVIVVVSF